VSKLENTYSTIFSHDYKLFFWASPPITCNLWFVGKNQGFSTFTFCVSETQIRERATNLYVRISVIFEKLIYTCVIRLVIHILTVNTLIQTNSKYYPSLFKANIYGFFYFDFDTFHPNPRRKKLLLYVRTYLVIFNLWLLWVLMRCE